MEDLISLVVFQKSCMKENVCDIFLSTNVSIMVCGQVVIKLIELYYYFSTIVSIIVRFLVYVTSHFNQLLCFASNVVL